MFSILCFHMISLYIVNLCSNGCWFQAHRLSEEANGYGNLQCTKVSAELKSARSMVRVQEIMATLQQQRLVPALILYKALPFITGLYGSYEEKLPTA